VSRDEGTNFILLETWKKPPAAKWIAKPCNELGYTIGIVHGDGCVYKNETRYEYKVILNTIDKEFAETFSKVMAKLLNRKYIEPRWIEKEMVWRVEYRSKAFYLWYKRTEKKGLQGFKPFIEHDTETVRHYLRGLYDSEGSNNGNKRVRLSNSKKKLLKYCNTY